MATYVDLIVSDFVCLIDVLLKSGDSPTIPLVECGSPPADVKERWKVIQKMNLMTQYAFAGDYTSKSQHCALNAFID